MFLHFTSTSLHFPSYSQKNNLFDGHPRINVYLVWITILIDFNKYLFEPSKKLLRRARQINYFSRCIRLLQISLVQRTYNANIIATYYYDYHYYKYFRPLIWPHISDGLAVFFRNCFMIFCFIGSCYWVETEFYWRSVKKLDDKSHDIL